MWTAAILSFLSALSFNPPGNAPEAITIFNLTYTLRFKPDNAQQVAQAWDHCHAAATLQGIVNRSAPRLYFRYVEAGGKNVDDVWLEKMTEPGGWLADRPRQTIPDLVGVIEKFRTFIKGAVVYDPNVPATSNLASTIAGVRDLVAVRYDPHPDSLYSAIITAGPKLPAAVRLLNEDHSSMFTGKGKIPGTNLSSTGSAKCDAYLWLKHHYIDTGQVDAGYAGYYIDADWMRNPSAAPPNHHTLTNHDFFVSKRAFFFDLNNWADETPVDDRDQKLGTDLNTFKALMLSAYQKAGKERMIHVGGMTPWANKYTNHGSAGGTHDPVPTEWEFVRTLSAYNAFIDADAIGLGAMANASFFVHFPLKPKYPQHWVTEKELKERGYLTPDGRFDFQGREFVIFYVGDYDSAAWVYQHMPTVWDHPERGQVPMMWCVSPVLERRAPMALDYLRRTATKNDYFAAADNGAGYLNPGMLQTPRDVSGLPDGFDAWVRHCRPLYDRWGITITGFVIDGYAPGLNPAGLDAYAKFSPNGIVPQKIPPSLLHGNMPVLRADHDINGGIEDSVKRIIARIDDRGLPFHWFRNILKSPHWYVALHDALKAAKPNVELLDGPTFFELFRIYLKNHPKAARGE